MTNAIRDLKNLGPKSEIMLAQIGINTLTDFNAVDPFEIYKQLKQSHQSTSINFLYAIIGARDNCHWQKVAKEQKTTILLRLDDLGLAPK